MNLQSNFFKEIAFYPVFSSMRLTLALALLFPITLSAQIQIEETIVTASRYEEKLTDAPHITELITQEEIIQQGFRTVPEAFTLTPGVSVQKTANAQGSPFIRGFTGRQNLFLIDGIRLNNSTFRSGPIQYLATVDGFGLNQIELVKSQGSVLFGSDALGGTVNVRTADSDFLEKEEDRFFQHGSLFYRYNTNSNSNLGRLQQSIGVGKKWGLTLGATVKDFGDVRSDFFGRQEGTGYQEQALDGKFEIALQPNLKITLAGQTLNQDNISRNHSTLSNPGGFAGLAPGEFDARDLDQERSLLYARIEHEPEAAWINRYQITASFQTTQDSQFQDRTTRGDTNPIRNQNIDTDIYGLSIEAQSTLPFGTTLIYGADYFEDRIDATGSRIDPLLNTFESDLPLADDSTYRSLGIFLQARHSWNDRLETTGGLRFTFIDAELDSINESANFNDLVFNARALYNLSEEWQIFGGASQGFRAPNVNDLTGNLTTRSGIQTTGNLDLEPERTLTLELGTRVQQERFQLESSFFATFVDDLIVGVEESPFDDDQTNINAAEAFILGAELEAKYHLTDSWSLNGFLTWQFGDVTRQEFINQSDGEITEPVSRLSPLRGSLALRYQDPSEKWWAELRGIAAARADRLSASDLNDDERIPPNGTPSYFALHLKGGWKVSDNLEFTATLNNLTDEDFRIHGSGFNEPGFGAILSTKLSW